MQSLQYTRNDIARLTQIRKEYEDLRELLRTLPERVTYPIMVPALRKTHSSCVFFFLF
jgi:hypothetical protein